MSEKIGKSLAKIHDANVIHGDLTTSNLMLRDSGSLVSKIKIRMYNYFINVLFLHFIICKFNNNEAKNGNRNKTK